MGKVASSIVTFIHPTWLILFFVGVPSTPGLRATLSKQERAGAA